MENDIDTKQFLEQCNNTQSLDEIVRTGLLQNLFQVFSEYYYVLNKFDNSINYLILENIHVDYKSSFYALEKFAFTAINSIIQNKNDIIGNVARKNFPTLYKLLFKRYIIDFQPIRKDICNIVGFIVTNRCTQNLLVIIDNSNV